MQPSAKVIADSIGPTGVRLTTLEVVMHRFVLAEFNTHRVFSRNSASSRAIPVTKILERVKTDPAYPSVWAREQPGMQGGTELEGIDLARAKQLFEDVRNSTVALIEDYLGLVPSKEHRAHKSLINRLLEPFMWHTVIVTATEWDGFWWQRCHKDAQPEIKVAAEAMKAAVDASKPEELDYGMWHMPYIDIAEDMDILDMYGNEGLIKASVARCARVSTLNHDGKKSIEDDFKLYDRLTDRTNSDDPPHASPLEHVATPVDLSDESYWPLRGNFAEWAQLRHMVLDF